MRSSILTSCGSMALLIAQVQADFGVWRVQETATAPDVDGGVGVDSWDYPLLTGGDVQSGADVYNFWASNTHWYDVECDGCGSGDAVDHSGGKFLIQQGYLNGDKLLFEALPDGEGKDTCSQLYGVKCDYHVIRNDNEAVAVCEYGGHALRFLENTMGVLAHIDGFRPLWCYSEIISS
ncbi:hypothetical protein G7Z17_g309 [Cylindrodendrum hubeiense]|uniref:Cyanovirin-N domain-containing protein n=1 Tax=Cylindrodendrum hubeiense TaxID=595255 RepID=A0A9P5HSI0_9HYPO|nr:hypothetical protein G7Z17_g309 [Cylindrodendrum hubeiense]